MNDEAVAARLAEDNLILLGTVGSTAHGLELAGTDDRDEMGVCIEPPEYVIGLEQFEQHVFRTKPEGVRSEAGDLDRVIYSLRKYARLALRGNPTVLLLFFVDEPLVITPIGRQLQDMAPVFASRIAGRSFLGYLVAQKERLLGERGQKRVKRPELEAAHGYDTKYAMHMLRLGYQGVEYLETGRITLPMPAEARDRVFAVRKGEIGLDDVLAEVAALERRLEDLVTGSPLPPEPDYAAVNEFLVEAYRAAW